VARRGEWGVERRSNTRAVWVHVVSFLRGTRSKIVPIASGRPIRSWAHAGDAYQLAPVQCACRIGCDKTTLFVGQCHSVGLRALHALAWGSSCGNVSHAASTAHTLPHASFSHPYLPRRPRRKMSVHRKSPGQPKKTSNVHTKAMVAKLERRRQFCKPCVWPCQPHQAN
jgi:hypothetical protein